MEWDSAITVQNKGRGLRQVVFPTDLSHAIAEAEYTRCRITLTDEGILLAPYKGDPPSVVLPEWEDWHGG